MLNGRISNIFFILEYAQGSTSWIEAEGEIFQVDSLLSSEPSARFYVTTHEIMTWPETKSPSLNQLTRLGAQINNIFMYSFVLVSFG